MSFMTGGDILSTAESFLSKLKNPLLEKPFDIPLVRRLLRSFVKSPAPS